MSEMERVIMGAMGCDRRAHYGNVEQPFCGKHGHYGQWPCPDAASIAAALSAAGFGLVADAEAEALDDLVANSPRLPSAVRNIVFEAVFDVVDKFNFPCQNMGPRADLVEIGDVCGEVERRIVAILRARAASARGEG